VLTPEEALEGGLVYAFAVTSGSGTGIIENRNMTTC
jgi:hypothetical protein